MTATPEAVSRFTSDGVLLTEKNEQTKTDDPNSIDGGDAELAMFFDAAADAAVVLKERFAFIGMVGRWHEAIEFDDSLGLGAEIPILPRAPRAILVDEARMLAFPAALRAYSFDGTSDTYACEFVGLPTQPIPGGGVTMDSTAVTMDDTSHTMDEA